MICPVLAEETEPVRTVINIENARTTTYQKDSGSEQDIILFEGDVRVSITKGTNATIISAEKITYNRETEMLYADGDITFQQVSASSTGGIDLTAGSLLFNTRTLEGFFDDGRVVQTQSDALNLPSGSTLIVISDLFGKSESNTITFKNGELTFCDDPDPHWRIKASRIWLLPGNEFAFLNALLFVGNIPVMYLPAFYYPKDELIFNPVFGYRPREGYFMQNTFYLFGRKPLDKMETSSSDSSDDDENLLSSMFNFLRPTKLKEQRREGLVLHNLDEDFTGSTTNYFKLMADWYSNLGVGFGVDGVYRPTKNIFSVEGNAMIGFSNTIFNYEKSYFPYTTEYEKHEDISNFLGLALPFRYQGDLKFSLQKPFSLSLNMPVYSDPYFTNDFLDRAETMDWINFLTTMNETEKEVNPAKQVSSFAWTLNGSYNVPLPKIVTPFLNSTSVSTASSLNFSSRERRNPITNATWSTEKDFEWKENSPERQFYYPTQITPANISASFSGTIFSYPLAKRDTSASAQNASPNLAGTLNVPDDLLPESQPAANGVAGDNASGASGGSASGDSTEQEPLLPDDALPVLLVPPLASVASSNPFSYSLTYSVQPAFTTQLAYAADKIYGPNDIDLEKVRSSMYTSRVPTQLVSSTSVLDGFFAVNNTVSFTPIWQGHPVVSEDTKAGGYTPSQITALHEADYRASTRDMSNTNSVSVRPLIAIPLLSDTNVSWRSAVKIIRTQFVGTAADPRWDYLPNDWSKESITENAIDVTLAATEGRNRQFRQAFTASSRLPPHTEEYNGNLSLTFPYVNFSLSSGITRVMTATNEPTEEWTKKPLNQSLSVNVTNKQPLSLTQTYIYNLQDEHDESLSFSLNWAELRLSYTMSYTYGYKFVAPKPGITPTGWVQRSTATDERSFLPYSLSMSYSSSSEEFKFKKDNVTLSPGLSTSIVADLLRPTNTTFLFSPTITFRINNALSLSFASTSRNSVLYRYIQKNFNSEIKIPGEENIFTDLLNSFRFDDENLRKASGFKLQNLSFSMTHDLHDWDLDFTFKLEPRLENGKFEPKPYVSFAVVWRPMQGMKTEIRDNYGEWQLNPKAK